MSTVTTVSDTTDQTWELYKETVRTSYLILDRSLEEVTKELNSTYHFIVSKAQVEYRCKKWNFRKSLTKEEWGILSEKIQKRKRDDKDTEVCIDGLPMNEKKVKKAMSRYGSSSVSDAIPAISAPSPQTPEGITIRTPVVSSATLTSSATSLSTAFFPTWSDYGSILADSLPFKNFQSAVSAGEQLENAQNGENIMSITSADDIQADIAAHFQIASTRTDKLALFSNKMDALMPQSLYADTTNSQLTSRRHGARSAIQFLNMTLYMVSNKMFSSTADMSKKMYKWIKRRKGKGLLDYILKIGGPTAEALAEHIFILAIDHEDARTIKLLLSSGVNPDEVQCSDGWTQLTPLQRVSQMRNLDLARLLVKAGADVNTTPSSVIPPLCYAVEHEDEDGNPKELVDIELVELLLNAGASINPSVARSPLMDAAAACHPELVDLLLAKGANPNFAEEDFGRSPLSEAVNSQGPISDKIFVVKRLLQAGADVHAQTDYDGDIYTLLMDAVSTSSTELIKMLLSHGAALSESALNSAINKSDGDVVGLLLDSGARITPKTIESAVKNKNTKVIEMLLDRVEDGVKETCRNEGLTAAIRYGLHDLVESLSKLGAMPRSGEKLRTAIESAAARGDIIVLRLLLDTDSKFRSSALDNLGCSLASAIAGGHDNIVELLLEAGADVNVVGSTSKASPLLEAIRQRNMHLSQKLLAAGALVNNRANSNYYTNSRLSIVSVLPAAVSWGYYPLIKEIIRAGAEINAPDSDKEDSKTALTIAVEKGDPVLIQQLIEAGADVNAPAAQRKGHTALVAAIKNNDLSMIRHLLKLGADPNESALIAAISRSTDLMQMLLTTKSTHLRQFPQGYGVRTLQHAIASSNTAMMEVLLQSGISFDVVARPQYGESLEGLHKDVRTNYESPLGSAIRLDNNADLNLIRMILKAGADPNKIVYESYYSWAPQTGLLAGIKRKQVRVVEMLVEYGADANSKTAPRIERTPLQSAVEEGAMDITKFLLEKGADVNAPPHSQRGATALQFAAINGFLGVASLLLEHGADVNAPAAKTEGRTALEGASEHGRIDMVQLLLSAGAQIVGSGGEQYQRAKDFATKNGHVAVRRLLEKFYHQQMDALWNWDAFTDPTVIDEFGMGSSSAFGAVLDDSTPVCA